MKISYLQDRFNKCFPNLKIEFYPDIRSVKIRRPAEPFYLVQYLNKKHVNGEMQIMSDDTIEKVLSNLKTNFGLIARIFRLKGSRYLEPAPDEHLIEDPEQA
jgi:hypothetical protein